MTKPPGELSDIELREAIAVEAMGYELKAGNIHEWQVLALFKDGKPEKIYGNHEGIISGLPCYESSVAEAFKALEIFSGPAYVITMVSEHNMWAVEIDPLHGPHEGAQFCSVQKSLPRAICVTMLIAIRAIKSNERKIT